MYEFSKKEIRSKFKETEYGKKTNKWLYMSLGGVGAVVFSSLVIALMIFLKVIKIDEELFTALIGIFNYFLFISLIIACYFDGKRDGAIEQFKQTLKK